MPSLRNLALGIVSVLLIALSLAVILSPFTAKRAHAQGMSKPDIIEVIEIREVITDGTAARMKNQVEKLNENPKVKAVLLLVDTPGGGASASAAIYAELARIKVPVVGLCESVCASGGMYALMSPSVKFIAVGEESVAGSIGVIGHLTRYSRLLDWAKIDVETYKSGEFKDDGNPTRSVTSAEKARIQTFVDELAQKFYGVVLKARPKVDLAAIKPAGVFIGEKAVSVGLADAVMPREKVLEKAKELSGSKLIFTREEIGKMTKDAHGDSSAYQAPVIAPRAEAAATWMADLHEIVEAMKEIKAGETVRFEYRFNYQF